jgi:hypothetical protein
MKPDIVRLMHGFLKFRTSNMEPNTTLQDRLIAFHRSIALYDPKTSTDHDILAKLGLDPALFPNINADSRLYIDPIRFLSDLCDLVPRFIIHHVSIFTLFPKDTWVRFQFAVETFLSKRTYYMQLVSQRDIDPFQESFPVMQLPTNPDTSSAIEVTTMPPPYHEVYVVDFVSNFPMYAPPHLELNNHRQYVLTSFPQALSCMDQLNARKVRKSEDDAWMMILRYVMQGEAPSMEGKGIEMSSWNLANRAHTIAGIALYKRGACSPP